MAINIPPFVPLPRPPQIDLEKIPQAEFAAAEHINELLKALALYEAHFTAALQLFAACEQERAQATFAVIMGALQKGGLTPENTDLQPWAAIEPTLGDWQEIAAREGALAIYHFGRILIAIGGSFQNCPTVRDAFNHEQLRLAKNSFEGAFPSAMLSGILRSSWSPSPKKPSILKRDPSRRPLARLRWRHRHRLHNLRGICTVTAIS